MRIVFCLFLLLCVPLLSSQTTNQGDEQGKGEFFGPKSRGLEVVDGAKNPELIAEPDLWDEFRRMVMNSTENNPNLPRPLREKMSSILRNQMPLVALLARKYDQEFRVMNEQRRKAKPDSLSNSPGGDPQTRGREAGAAILERFKTDVLNLLDGGQKAELEHFLRTDVVKRVKFFKLPSR